MTDQYGEEGLEVIHKQVGGWFDDFVKSAHYDPLTEIQRDEAPGVVRFFAEHAYRYIGVAPEEWDRGTVSECCVEILPRKVTAKLPFFQAVAPVLSAFFAYLGEKALLPKARALAKTVADLDEEIVAASQNTRGWGPAKAFAMAAEEAGVDLCDKQAMDQFMAAYNVKMLARMPAPRPALMEPTVPLPAPATPVRHTEPKTGRNDPCPCGSGKKFKKCCGR
jgi:hypothetical protein